MAAPPKRALGISPIARKKLRNLSRSTALGANRRNTSRPFPANQPTRNGPESEKSRNNSADDAIAWNEPVE
jgi:hypothetical protein